MANYHAVYAGRYMQIQCNRFAYTSTCYDDVVDRSVCTYIQSFAVYSCFSHLVLNIKNLYKV